MANLPVNDQEWQVEVYQIEKSDPVLGGVDGITNVPLKQLASRTAYLKRLLEEIQNEIKNLSYTDVNAAPASHAHTTAQVTGLDTALAGKVSNTRKVAGKALSADINLTAADVGAAQESHAHTTAQVTGLDNLLSDKSDKNHNHDSIYAKVVHTHAWTNITGVPIANTSTSGLVKLIDAVNNGSITDASTANSVKMLRDMLIGIPLPWPLSTPPSWGLKLNGAAFSAASYPILAQRYPSLILPDIRADVIRGLDDGRGVDISRAILTEQLDAIQNLVGNINIVHGGGSISGIFKKNATNNGHISASLNGTDPGIEFNASLVARTASETRMRNIAFNYITIAG